MRPSHSLVPVFLLVSFVAPAQVRVPETGFEDLDASVESLMAQHQIPGTSIAIVRNGKLVTVRGYGAADVEAGQPFLPASMSRWNSISKTLTAAGILKLVEQGKLDLDARAFDILSHVRPYNGRWGDARIPNITVRQLLHHTGGWDRGRSGDPLMPPRRDNAAAALGRPTPPSAETMASYTVAFPLDFEPGTRYCYSNFGFLVLGLVVEKVSGEPYESFVRKQVLDPVAMSGMRCARNRLDQRQPGEVRYYDYPQNPLLASVFLPGNPMTPGPYAYMDFENILPVGGWLGSVVQLARFAEALDGRRPPAILTPESVAMMVAQVDRSLWLDDHTWYGLGMLCQTFPDWEVWNHNGGSQGSRSSFVRVSNGYSFALLVNGEGIHGGDTFCGALTRTLTNECMKRRPWPDQDLFLEYLAPHLKAVVNAAGFRAGPVAPDSLATLSGAELGRSGAAPVTLRMRDAAGSEHAVALLHTSLAQVNFHVPPGAAEGEATLTAQREPHPAVSIPLPVARIAPGLFAANQEGLAAATVTRVRGGAEVVEDATQPIRPGETSEEVYLTLYGTGFRGRSALGAVTVLFDGKAGTPESAGPHPASAGLDQVKIRLSPDLAHSGKVNISLQVDGAESNTVWLVFE